MKGTTHGALSILGEQEARRSAHRFVVEVDQGVVETYQDYLDLAAETQLPRALGSIIFQSGAQGPTRAVRQVQRRHDGWQFNASAVRSYRFTEVHLRRQRRPYYVGYIRHDDLFFYSDSPVQGTVIHDGSPSLNDHSMVSLPHPPLGLDKERLSTFLTYSQGLIQELLDATVSPPQL